MSTNAKVSALTEAPKAHPSSTLFSGLNEDNTPCHYIVESSTPLERDAVEKLEYLLQAKLETRSELKGSYVGPRREMVTPWSTNASEIARNVGIPEITRIECFLEASSDYEIDLMLQERYDVISRDLLTIDRAPEPTIAIDDIAKYNTEMGLALSDEEVSYLKRAQEILKRPLTDAEVFGFAQINSEHCRHKIFNGKFVVNDIEMPDSLFALIKKTSKNAPENLVSAYSDNVAFLRGPRISQFAPLDPTQPSLFDIKPVDTVISMKAETHNYPTQVEPFNGAATGSGGEIRDRLAGGTGSIPLVGSAVYMTAYPRIAGASANTGVARVPARPWLYQRPEQILIQASNGASDYGNKIGQPLITGSVFTYELKQSTRTYAYDKPIMLAGGVGYALTSNAHKKQPKPGDKIVLLGGDNYRIGLGGGAVSSVKGGELSRAIELSAVQRANAEMQKRVLNTVRALAESDSNPILMIHDHGAGGHMNCLTELVEASGGKISIARLPLGDPTLSERELLSNESQERMGLVISNDALPLLEAIASRERAPCYVIGEITDDARIVFENANSAQPVALPLSTLLGSSPRSVIVDKSNKLDNRALDFKVQDPQQLLDILVNLFSLEAVASKEWLTNKVDRSVTGRVAQQQCVGPLQLPLADLGVVALDYSGTVGIATAIGHAPSVGLIDEVQGAVISVVESLTNIVWAPLKNGLASVALSANWAWPCGREGESARLYSAVEALSDCASKLGIPVPTGKDSLSMVTKYDGKEEVLSPGTVVVTAVGEVDNLRSVVTPDLKDVAESVLLYVDISGDPNFPLGGSALAQLYGELGGEAPRVKDLAVVARVFNELQAMIRGGEILCGHDISSGGLITALCEVAFAGDIGLSIDLEPIPRELLGAALFCEKPGVIVQVACELKDSATKRLTDCGAVVRQIATLTNDKRITIKSAGFSFSQEDNLSTLRQAWRKRSYELDKLQLSPGSAEARFNNLDKQALKFKFPENFSARASDYRINLNRGGSSEVLAAIIREKGTNGDREMAYALHSAGFAVRDVTMSDLMNGSETLDKVRFIVFPGGFSNSDVLGAGRGWAAAFKYNQRALSALTRFMERRDTLSLGVCNGCQLMVALGLLYPGYKQPIAMQRNLSHKFESAFINVDVRETKSILLRGLIGSTLGVWVSHGEGRFILPEGEASYDLPLRYSYAEYPGNPNGADFMAAGVCSADGRHLAMMPHLERSFLPWQWGYYPGGLEAQTRDEVSPWALAFAAGYSWLVG